MFTCTSSSSAGRNFLLHHISGPRPSAPINAPLDCGRIEGLTPSLPNDHTDALRIDRPGDAFSPASYVEITCQVAAIVSPTPPPAPPATIQLRPAWRMNFHQNTRAATCQLRLPQAMPQDKKKKKITTSWLKFAAFKTAWDVLHIEFAICLAVPFF